MADPGLPAVELHVPRDQLAAPTVAFVGADTELPEPMSRHVAQTISVPAVDVRSLLPGVDLLKLDVEGQEHALLAAGREHLRTHRPTVFVEVLPGTARLRRLLADLCRLEIPDILGAPLLDRYGGQDVIVSPEPHLDRWRP